MLEPAAPETQAAAGQPAAAGQQPTNITSITEERKKKARKKRKRHTNPFAVLLILIALAAGILVFLNSSFFDVEEFTVEGNSYYLDDEILTMGNCKTGKNIFWGTDCSDIKARLEKDAYMAEVKVTRKLPRTISIELTERKQVGAIVYGAKYVVIDANGTVLRKTEVDPEVTILRGFTISKLEMGQTIEVEEGVLFHQALDLLEAMDANDMYFKAISVGKTTTKAYILDNLIVSGSADDITAALKSGKIQIVTEKLFDDDIERGTIKVSDGNDISFTPKID